MPIKNDIETEGQRAPDGDGVALQGVSEVRHRAGADEAVERLDDVEQSLEGGQERERRPVPRVRRRGRRSVGGGGLHLLICPDVDLRCNANRARHGAIEQCCCPRLVILLPAGSIRWAALLVILFFFISKDSLKRCQVLFVKTKESKVKSLGKKQGNTKSRTGSKIFPFFIRGVIMIGNFFSLVRACL
jgi:hypothetical protein